MWHAFFPVKNTCVQAKSLTPPKAPVLLHSCHIADLGIRYGYLQVFWAHSLVLFQPDRARCTSTGMSQALQHQAKPRIFRVHPKFPDTNLGHLQEAVHTEALSYVCLYPFCFTFRFRRIARSQASVLQTPLELLLQYWSPLPQLSFLTAWVAVVCSRTAPAALWPLSHQLPGYTFPLLLPKSVVN